MLGYPSVFRSGSHAENAPEPKGGTVVQVHPDDDLNAVFNQLENESKVIIHTATYPVYQGLALNQRQNIRIEGKGEVVIVADWTGESIMEIFACEEIFIKGLSLKRTSKPEPFEGDKGIDIWNSKGVTVKGCQLIQSGSIGIGINESENVMIKGNLVKGHSDWAFEMDEGYLTEPSLPGTKMKQNKLAENGNARIRASVKKVEEDLEGSSWIETLDHLSEISVMDRETQPRTVRNP